MLACGNSSMRGIQCRSSANSFPGVTLAIFWMHMISPVGIVSESIHCDCNPRGYTTANPCVTHPSSVVKLPKDNTI